MIMEYFYFLEYKMYTRADNIIFDDKCHSSSFVMVLIK